MRCLCWPGRITGMIIGATPAGSDVEAYTMALSNSACQSEVSTLDTVLSRVDMAVLAVMPMLASRVTMVPMPLVAPWPKMRNRSHDHQRRREPACQVRPPLEREALAQVAVLPQEGLTGVDIVVHGQECRRPPSAR